VPLYRIMEERNEKITQLYQVEGIPYLFTYLLSHLLTHLLTYLLTYILTY